MSLRPVLRPVDRNRARRAVEAWCGNDLSSLTLVMREADADPADGSARLLYAVLGALDWVTQVADFPEPDASGADQWLADLTDDGDASPPKPNDDDRPPS